MWIQTYTGKKFSFVDPQPESIDIFDIAHSLSNQCRFNGHCKSFYSISQHSMHVSDLCSEKLAGQGFAHDFSEAVLGDVSSPLKSVLEKLSDSRYTEFVKKIEKVFAYKFGFPYPLDREVRYFDLVALATEKRDLMSHEPEPWCKLPPADRLEIIPIGVESAKGMFLKRYRELQAEGLIL